MRDKSSDSWWWCTLFAEAEIASGDGGAQSANDANKRKRGAEDTIANDDNSGKHELRK
jgi:hypothetical protein